MIHPFRVLTDPDFHQLPDFEKLKVLYTIDPEYRKLNPRERWKVVNMVPKSPTQSTVPAPSPMPKGNSDV